MSSPAKSSDKDCITLRYLYSRLGHCSDGGGGKKTDKRKATKVECQQMWPRFAVPTRAIMLATLFYY